MNISWIGRVWVWVKWPLLVLLVLFVGACIYYINEGGKIVRSQQAVARIHANRLTWSDINGTLPAEPDPTENNKTLAGVDANNNGIRDDVEIAIYNKHQNNWKVAIPELQYAKELQMEFTQVYNSDTLIAVLQEEDRGYQCIPSETGQKEVYNLIFNISARTDFEETTLKKYMKGYALPNTDYCDIDPSTYK